MKIEDTLKQLDELADQIIDPHDNIFRQMAESVRAEVERLKQDKARLDFLESAHDALNSRYGTNYGWKLIINHNVIRTMVKDCHPWDGKDGIDLHDSQGGRSKCKTCRDAIDEVISENSKAL